MSTSYKIKAGNDQLKVTVSLFFRVLSNIVLLLYETTSAGFLAINNQTSSRLVSKSKTTDKKNHHPNFF